MKTLQEIESTLRERKGYLISKYPIKSIAIFGSYSRNENIPDSDLDLLVEFESQIGIRFIDLAEELESLVNMKVDLVSKNGIKSKYLSAIENELIYV